jgi:hypothetical protein
MTHRHIQTEITIQTHHQIYRDTSFLLPFCCVVVCVSFGGWVWSWRRRRLGGGGEGVEASLFDAA